MSTPAEAAWQILESNRYVVLATTDAAGRPWATPLWFAHRGLDLLLWVSPPDARHSRALVEHPQLAVTVFDASVEPGHGTAFYGRGSAAECTAEELADLVAIYSDQAVAQGIRAWTASDLGGEARHRLWVARLEEVSVLLDVPGPERRVPVKTAP